jgi:hypothetical protein
MDLTQTVCVPCASSSILLTKVDETYDLRTGSVFYYDEPFYNISINFEQSLIYRTASIERIISTFGSLVLISLLAALAMKDCIGVVLSGVTVSTNYIIHPIWTKNNQVGIAPTEEQDKIQKNTPQQKQQKKQQKKQMVTIQSSAPVTDKEAEEDDKLTQRQMKYAIVSSEEIDGITVPASLAPGGGNTGI